MQLRTYLRIEGELVSHVTEKVEREVELSALLDEVVRNQPISTGRLPANTRFLVRLGEREAYVLEQPPMRRVIEFHATQRAGSEPATYRLALPYVVFVVGVEAGQIVPLCELLPHPADPLDRRSALPLVPAEHVGRRRRLPRLGAGLGPIGRRANRCLDRRLLGEPLQPGPPSPSAAVLRRLSELGVPEPKRPARGTDPSIRPHLADDPPGRRLHGRRGRAGHSRLRRCRTRHQRVRGRDTDPGSRRRNPTFGVRS